MTLAVIRILKPDDYGLMAITQVFVNVMAGFATIGLGDALVQREGTSKTLAAAVFGLSLLLSAILTVLLALAAYPIAAWYHDPRLIRLIQVASLGFLMNGLTTLPRISLTKSLRIRPMIIVEMSSGLVASVVILALAYSGVGVWSLMIGMQVGAVIRMIGLMTLATDSLVWPTLDLKVIGPLYSFGAYRLLSYLAWLGFTSADTLILGRFFGPAELGLYTVAQNFAAMPLNKIAPIINQVAFPAFALVQRESTEARFYAMKATRLMALVSVPVFFGISAVAPEIVSVVFGTGWGAATPILAVLSVAMIFRAILLVIPNYLQGIGDARASFWCTSVGLVLFPPAFLIGCRWGVQGVCYAWLLGYPVMYAASAFIASRQGHLDFKALLATPLPPIIAGAVMFAAVFALRSCLPADQSAVVRAAILVAAGAATYGTFMLVAFRPLVLEVVSLVYRRGATVA